LLHCNRNFVVSQSLDLVGDTARNLQLVLRYLLGNLGSGTVGVNTARDKIYLAALRTEWPFLGWVPELVFHPVRMWRFDFASPVARVALEIEGGIWMQGRHNRGAGMIADMHKYNAAVGEGWKLIRVTPQMMEKEWPVVAGWIDKATGGLADV